MRIELGITYIIVLIVGFLGRVLWDWHKSGRVEKGLYVKIDDCKAERKECCVPKIKKDLAKFEAQQTATEKRLDIGHTSLVGLRDDIGGIKEDVAGMKPLVEKIADKIVLK